MFIGTVPQSIQNFRSRRVTINRPLYREEDIQSLCDDKDDVKQPLLSRTVIKCKQKCRSYSCKDVLKSLLSFFPIFAWLRRYKKSYILRDLSAGLTLGVMQIPQGMAYGMLTTLPPIYGLYVSLVPVLVYFLMGSSNHVSVGTFAIISLMVGETVESQVEASLPVTPPNGTSVEEAILQLRVKYAVTTSFIVGVIQTIFGILHFDFITIFLSDPLISGFTTGAGFHIFSSQVKHLVGMDIPREETSGFFSLFKIYGYIFSKIKEVNYVSFIIGVVASILLFVIKFITEKYKEKLKFPIPAELIVVALGTGLSYGFKFHERFHIKVLKSVPKSLPPLSYPSFDLFSKMLVDCLIIAIVSYAISVSVAKAFAKKRKQKIDANQELYAFGLSNIVSSFFSCFVCSVSLSRSLIQENLGSTQLSSLISCSLILLVLVLLAPIFEPLPNAILAAVVLVALKGLFRQFSVVKVFLKISKVDAFIWISSFISVILFGVDYGLGVGFILNLLATVIRASRPSHTLMGNLQHTEIYTNLGISSSEEIPGVKIFRFHAPLFYANVEYFQETLYNNTVSPTNCIKWPVPACYQVSERSASIIEDPVKHHNSYIPPKDPENNHITEHPLGTSSDDKPIFVSSNTHPFCPTHTIILDCSQLSYTDSMGVSSLITVHGQYQNVGVDVFLSNCPSSLLSTLQAGGFTSLCNVNNIFLTTHDAVNYACSHLHTEGICDPRTPSKIERSTWELITVKGNDDINDVNDNDDDDSDNDVSQSDDDIDEEDK